MSSLYSWHNECMVRLEMKDLYAEIEQIRLLQDASQTKPSWFSQQVGRVMSWMAKAGFPMNRRRSAPVPQYYQSTSFKFSL